ncbi:MAG: hypothetical protein PHS04_00255 [Tissierellia bacterium]|nr:hypothetical protein [Tissierellia bacterium]
MNPFEYFRNLKETLTKEDPIYIDESSEGVLDFIGLYKEVRLDIFDCEKVIERIDRIYQSINNEYQLDVAEKYCERLIFAAEFSYDVHLDLLLYHYTKKVEYRNKFF